MPWPFGTVRKSPDQSEPTVANPKSAMESPRDERIRRARRTLTSQLRDSQNHYEMAVHDYKSHWNKALASLQNDPPQVCELRLLECFTLEKKMKLLHRRWNDVDAAVTRADEMATADSLFTILRDMVTAFAGRVDDSKVQRLRGDLARQNENLDKMTEALVQPPQSKESVDSIGSLLQRAPQDEVEEKERLQTLRTELESQLHKMKNAGAPKSNA